MKPGKLILFGGQYLSNEIVRVEDSGALFKQQNDISSAERINAPGSVVSDAKRVSQKFGLSGSLSVPNDFENLDRTLLDLKTELDAALNAKNRFLRYIWDYRIMDQCEDDTKWSGYFGASDTEFDVDYDYFQLGEGSLSFDITGGVIEAVVNGGFETFTGTADDGTTDTVSPWVMTGLGTGSYADIDAAHEVFGTYCLELHKGTGDAVIYQDVFLKASTDYVLSVFMESDGTGTFKAKMQVQDDSDQYLQDDGSTWGAADNTIDDLDGSTSDDYGVRRTFRFTTKNYTGLYRLMLLNDANNSSVYIDGVSVREGDESKISFFVEQKQQIDEYENTEVAAADWGDGLAGSDLPLCTLIDDDGNIYLLYQDDGDSKGNVVKFDSGLNELWDIEVSTNQIQDEWGALVIDDSGFLWAFFEKSSSTFSYSKLSVDGEIVTEETAISGYRWPVQQCPAISPGNGFIYLCVADDTGSDGDKYLMKIDISDESVDDTVKYADDGEGSEATPLLYDDVIYIVWKKLDDPTYNQGYLCAYDLDLSQTLSDTLVIPVDSDQGIEDGITRITAEIDSAGNIWIAYTRRYTGSNDWKVDFKKVDREGNDLIDLTEITDSTDYALQGGCPRLAVDNLDNMYITYIYYDGSNWDTRMRAYRPDGTNFISSKDLWTTISTNWCMVEAFESIPNESTALIRGDGLGYEDLSDVSLTGSLAFSWYIPDIYYVESVVVRIGNDEDNYYESGSITENYEQLSFYRGWNVIVVNWSDMTETGTVDDSALDFFELEVTLDDEFTSITGMKIDGLMWVNETETRNYKAWLSDLDYVIKKQKIATFKANFFAQDGVGFSTFAYSALSEDSIEETSYESELDFSAGSFEPLPVFTLSLASVSSVGSVRLTNETNGQYTDITIAPEDNDILEIDHENGTVELNDEAVVFTGLPEWDLGINRFSITFTGDSPGSISQETHDTYYGDGNADQLYLFQTFESPASGRVTQFEIYMTCPGAEPAGWGAQIYTADGSGEPDTFLGYGTYYGASAEWKEPTVLSNMNLISGSTYGIQINTQKRVWSGTVDNKVYANSAGGYGDGTLKKSADEASWTDTSDDMAFRITVTPTPTLEYDLDVEYRRRYY